MKKFLISFTAVAVLCVIFFACSDDDNNNVVKDTAKNKLNYNNIDYELTTGLMVDMNTLKVGETKFLVLFYTDGITIPVTYDGYAIIHGANGMGSLLGLNIYSSNSEYIEEGVYNYDPDNGGNEGTFTDGGMLLNIDIAEEVLTDTDNEVEIDSGTLTVKKIVGGYEFELDCICEKGNDIKVTYKGSINKYGFLVNYFMYDGKIYNLDKAIMTANKNGSSGNYIIGFGLLSSDVNIIETEEEPELEGTGNLIYFAVCSEYPNFLEHEDFEFVLYSEDIILKDGQFYDFEFTTNHNFVPGVEDNLNILLSGTLNTDEDDNEYEFVFSGIDAEGKRLIGFFIGVPNYYDYTHLEY